jgi:Temperature dependent protein affecting M2 dsRNA replication
MPLISDTGAALGVVARTYLDSDELKVDDFRITPEIKTQLKSLRGDYAWFKKAVNETLKRDLRTVWRIWEAVFEGVGVLGGKEGGGGRERDVVVGGGKMWEEANEWVSVRY